MSVTWRVPWRLAASLGAVLAAAASLPATRASVRAETVPFRLVRSYPVSEATWAGTAGDLYVPGKLYRLCVRVKCPQPSAEGDAFSCGIYGKAPLPSIEKTVHTRDLRPGNYQTFEIGAIALAPGHSFWICTAKRNDRYAVSEVRLDAFWLSEVE